MRLNPTVSSLMPRISSEICNKNSPVLAIHSHRGLIPHSFFPEAVPGLTPTLFTFSSSLPLNSTRLHACSPPALTMTPQTDDFVSQIPIPIPIPIPNPSPSPLAANDAVVQSPCPQLTLKYSFTRDPANPLSTEVHCTLNASSQS